MVDSAVLVRGPPTNQPIKRRSIEKPRPLRSDPDLVCLGEILKLIDEVEVSLKNIEARNDIRTRIKVQQLKESLRLKGSIVERNTKEVLDALEVCMKNACRDTNLDIITRLNLLEILELRLNSWHTDPALAALYRQKIAEAQLDIDMKKIGYSGNSENLNNNNKVAKPEANPIICMMSPPPHFAGDDKRNSPPAGCQAGNAIKQMLQPPRFKIPSELMLPDASSSLLDPPDHCASLLIKGDRILISSNSKELVKTSKDVLQEYFSVAIEDGKDCSMVQQFAKPRCYEKDELMKLSKSPLCKQAPVNWDKILEGLPMIAKKPTASSKHFLREMEGIRKQEAFTAPLRKM